MTTVDIEAMCTCRKVLYESRSDAQRARARTGLDLRQIYRCPTGQGWHTSTMSKAEYRAQRKRQRIREDGAA